MTNPPGVLGSYRGNALLGLAWLIAISACGRLPSPVDDIYPADASQAIGRARVAQNAAITAMDWDRVASYWTDDVIIRAGLGLAIAGRDAYRDAFRRETSMRYVRTTESVRVSTEWPLAWEMGEWVGIDRRSGDALISGTYAAQWVRASDGRWRIRSELFVALDCDGRGCDLRVAPPAGGGDE